MSAGSPPVVLDADGVFLSERPYWNAALGTALALGGLADRVGGRWDRLADLAFVDLGLQRVTKAAGCNSNWDLAAVLTRALDREPARTAVGRRLETEGGELAAMRVLETAAACLRDAAPDAEDPLERFGVRRRSPFFDRVVDVFQRVLVDQQGLDWSFPLWQPHEPVETIRRALGDLRAGGHTLGVCTGRPRIEIEAPVRALGLETLLPVGEIVCNDDVARAEALSGRSRLGKPHWFSPACATVGAQEALAALTHDRRLSGNGVFVGDAWADFRSARSCRARGLDLRFVHVRSGVTTASQEHAILAAEGTLGAISSLGEIVSLLEGALV